MHGNLLSLDILNVLLVENGRFQVGTDRLSLMSRTGGEWRSDRYFPPWRFACGRQTTFLLLLSAKLTQNGRFRKGTGRRWHKAEN